MTFSCDYRVDLLTALQAFQHKFSGDVRKSQPQVYSAFKEHWSETRREVLLSPRASALVQVNRSVSLDLGIFFFGGFKLVKQRGCLFLGKEV